MVEDSRWGGVDKILGSSSSQLAGARMRSARRDLPYRGPKLPGTARHGNPPHLRGGSPSSPASTPLPLCRVSHFAVFWSMLTDLPVGPRIIRARRGEAMWTRQNLSRSNVDPSEFHRISGEAGLAARHRPTCHFVGCPTLWLFGRCSQICSKAHGSLELREEKRCGPARIYLHPMWTHQSPTASQGRPAQQPGIDPPATL